MAVNFKSRAFQIPGIIFLFLSFALLFIASISLPYLTDLDYVRVHFKDSLPTVGNDTDPVTDVRVSPPSPTPQYAQILTGYCYVVSVVRRAICSLALGKQVEYIVLHPR